MRRLAYIVLLTACSDGGAGAPPTSQDAGAPDVPCQMMEGGPGNNVMVASVLVTAPSATLAVGTSQQVSAVTKNASGTVLTGRMIMWSTSAPSVVSVSQSGLATALSAGTATITAFCEQQTGSTLLTVVGGMPSDAGAPGDAPGGSPADAAAVPGNLFTSLGRILVPADFGVTMGPVADATAIQLTDGRVRLYLFAQGQGTRSAISTDATGTSFTAEPGVRSNGPAWGQPRILRLSDGRVRLYYFAGDGIRSATSTDGLIFVDDPGIRIAKATLGYEPGAPTIVAMAGGGHRAYFSDLERPGQPPGGHYIRSATSTDLLNWTVEPGIVLGVGATTGITETATHPFALANADGSVSLYYQGERQEGGGSYLGIYRASSPDGRTFTTEQKTGIRKGGDPDVITLANGTTMMYYGDVEPQIGGVLFVAKATAAMNKP
jgi:hypothetical protein